MDSRDKILQAVKAGRKSTPPQTPPVWTPRTPAIEELTTRFETTLTGIGGNVVRVFSWHEIIEYIHGTFTASQRILSAVPALDLPAAAMPAGPHSFEDVDLIVLEPHFGVAENGAAWLTDSRMPDRVLPFIAQHIALVLRVEDLVPTMQEAYARIGSEQYELGTFIAGPSKTADIEQSLVLGAHGPKSMTVFLLQLS
ncbi:LutC/YkgG family protein [Dawidia soli]|uniref:LUD domain-containing protein n=1 Tax=Dawidia soli TaxID=2782352 RepID=A0AAP2D7X3_9BACT|nr:LUD domain-containing protein [Dawidia soli]MBT1686246.1 LUD domain-containing protein [Dawidia soli]